MSAPDRRKLAAGSLSPTAVLGIAVAAISPTTSVFLVYGDGYQLAGSGVVWAFVIGGLIAFSMALCYAEVGSVFPSAGGAYTIVRKALGPMWGGLAAMLFLVLGISATASILVSAATFLNDVLPGDLPVNWVALTLMVIVTVLSLERIGPTGWVTTAMLILELAVIVIFTIAAFFHVSPHHDSLMHPVVHHGGLAQGLGFAGLLAAVVPALFAFNGYDWPLYFAEEASNRRRVLPRAVLLAAGISILFELAAVVAATLAIKDPAALASEESPLTAISHDVLGSTGTTVLLSGVVVAMFDTGLAGNLGYARVFYAVARDDLWPGPLNRFFGHISERNQVPVNGILVLFAGNAVLCMATQLQNLITFTGVVIVTIYLLIACSAIVCRVRDARLERPFRMPLWPLAPVIGLLGCVAALSQQTERDLTITGIIVVVSLGAYALAYRRLPARLAGESGSLEAEETR